MVRGMGWITYEMVADSRDGERWRGKDGEEGSVGGEEERSGADPDRAWC